MLSFNVYYSILCNWYGPKVGLFPRLANPQLIIIPIYLVSASWSTGKNFKKFSPPYVFNKNLALINQNISETKENLRFQSPKKQQNKFHFKNTCDKIRK